jgi:hypothetical protein
MRASRSISSRPRWTLLDARGCTLQGLFTFAQSPKHVGLYQRFDFWPRHLAAVMARPSTGAPPAAAGRCSLRRATRRCRRSAAWTDAVYEGFDPTIELRSVRTQRLGDTVLLRDGDRVVGLAVCHCGAGSEAGGGACYVKVGAVAPGAGDGERFERLLDACAAFAVSRGLGSVVAGVDTAQRDAYRRMTARGYRTVIQGVVMVRGADQSGSAGPTATCSATGAEKRNGVATASGRHPVDHGTRVRMLRARVRRGAERSRARQGHGAGAGQVARRVHRRIEGGPDGEDAHERPAGRATEEARAVADGHDGAVGATGGPKAPLVALLAALEFPAASRARRHAVLPQSWAVAGVLPANAPVPSASRQKPRRPGSAR